MIPLGATSRALSGTTRPEAPAQTTVELVARRPRASRTVIRPTELQMLDVPRPSMSDVQREARKAYARGDVVRARVLSGHIRVMLRRAAQS